MDFQTQFKAARRVSTPLVAVRTFDAKSTIASIREALNGKLSETPIIQWDCIQGMIPLTEKGQDTLSDMLGGNPQEITVPLVGALQVAVMAPGDVILYISNAHLHWVNEPAVIQGIWNLRDSFKANGNMLVLLTTPGANLPTELTNDVLVIEEPLPTAEQLESIILDTYKSAKKDSPDAATMGKAVDALIGLPTFPADQSAAMCLNSKGELDITELWERKRKIVSQTRGLSIWQGTESLDDIGGVEQAKRFMCRVMEGKRRPKTIIFIDEIEKAFAGTGTDMSGVKTELTGSMLSWMQDRKIRGVLFIGLPGTVKSQLSKALGGTYTTPVVNFDLAGMQSGIVGSSGDNLRMAQKTVDAISGGDVLAIATCNSITALPPELRRRFNLGIFFFDAPDSIERKVIWDIYRKQFEVPESEDTPNDTGWTGAEIKECCEKAYLLNMTLAESATYIVPVTRSSADLVRNLRESSSNKYLSASKPGVYVYSGETETKLSPHDFPVAVDGRKMREVN